MKRWMLCMGLLLVALAPAPPALAGPPQVPQDTLAERVKACTACHGEQGRAGPDGYYPRLAGKPAGYLYQQLLNFAQGRRHYGPMAQLVDPLTPAYLRVIAEHFAGLQVPYPPPLPVPMSPAAQARARQLVFEGDAARGLPSCAHCHGQQLMGVRPHVPGLLGLSQDYLNAQLGAWQTRQRRAAAPDCMARLSGRLSAQDLVAVTAWLSSQPVPRDSRPASAADLPRPGPDWHCGSAPELQGPAS